METLSVASCASLEIVPEFQFFSKVTVLKILAFSDLHRDVEATRTIVAASTKADVLVGAGDFATCGHGAAEIIQILRTANTPTILVSGNHDNSNELRKLCSSWPQGYLLNAQPVTLANITFFGLGGEIPQRNNAEWNEAVSEEEASKALAICPDNAILITHMPPFGHADLQRDGTHDGSKSITAAIEKKQPVLHFCGHIHSAWGMSGKIGTTSIHNLGPTVNWFEL